MFKESHNIRDILDIAKIAEVPPKIIEDIANNPPAYYTEFKLKKKNSRDQRTINPPIPELRIIQKRLKTYIEKKLIWLPCVHGGVKGKSIISNAKPHVGRKMVANLDISGFFPSTTYNKIKSVYLNAGCSVVSAEILAHLTTFQNRLPQGSPMSMLLGNIVLNDMDKRFLKLCNRNDLSYTRYVDDLTISGNKRLEDFKSTFIKYIKDADYEVSMNKLNFTGQDKRQIVTGLVVNKKIRPTAKFIQTLISTIKDCWPENDGPRLVAYERHLGPRQLRQVLLGQLNFLKSIDKRLGRDIFGLMVKVNWTR